MKETNSNPYIVKLVSYNVYPFHLKSSFRSFAILLLKLNVLKYSVMDLSMFILTDTIIKERTKNENKD